MNASVLAAITRQLASDAEQRAAQHRQSAEADDRQAASWRALGESIATASASETSGDAPSSAQSWRERIWAVPAETRLSLRDAAEALGCSRSTLYHRIDAGRDPANARIPHRKRANGTLEFLAGELRSWIAQNAAITQAGVLHTVAARRLRRSSPRRSAKS